MRGRGRSTSLAHERADQGVDRTRLRRGVVAGLAGRPAPARLGLSFVEYMVLSWLSMARPRRSDERDRRPGQRASVAPVRTSPRGWRRAADAARPGSRRRPRHAGRPDRGRLGQRLSGRSRARRRGPAAARLRRPSPAQVDHLGQIGEHIVHAASTCACPHWTRRPADTPRRRPGPCAQPRSSARPCPRQPGWRGSGGRWHAPRAAVASRSNRRVSPTMPVRYQRAVAAPGLAHFVGDRGQAGGAAVPATAP